MSLTVGEGRFAKEPVAFHDERVDIELDGEPAERPDAQWSR